MLVLAKSVKGKEFWYNAKSAHKVSKASVGRIKAELNRIGYRLNDGEIWEVHEVSEYYDDAGEYAQDQRFYFYKGALREQRYWNY